MKIVGILLIGWGISAFLSKYRTFQLMDFNLLAALVCWGMVFIFFSKEKIDDERIHQMKFQALTWAVPTGLFITHLINYFFIDQDEPNSGKLIDSISAYESLAVILLLAFGLFHYLRYKK